ncbi:MAG: PorV/PorQ family protein [Balneolaceae bacterium]
MTARKCSLLLIILPILVLFNTSNTQAQVAITAVPFLQINNDARSIGMAGANVAMRNSRAGMHLNPATFGRKNTLQFTTQINATSSEKLFGTDWLPGFNVSELQLYTPQFIMGFEKLSVGYQYTYLNLGLQAHVSEEMIFIENFNSYERAHTISASYNINQHISVGVGMNAIKSNLASGVTIGGQQISWASRISWDMGFYADYPFQKEPFNITPSFGWSLTDVGNPITYTTPENADALPIMMRGGLGLKISYPDKKNGFDVFSLGGYISRDKIMARWKEDGSAMGPLEAIFKSWDYFERFNGMETISLSLKDQLLKHKGVEFTMLDMFSFRVGRFYEHPENGARKYNTIGFGIHYKYFSMDYAEMNTDERDHPLDKTKFVEFTVNVPLD